MLKTDELEPISGPVNIFSAIMKFLLLLLPVLFNPDLIDAFNLPKVTIFRLSLLLMLGIWIMKTAISRETIFKKTKFDLPILIYWFAVLFSFLFSINRFHSFFGQHMYHFDGLLAVTSYVIFFLVLVHVFEKEEIEGLIEIIVYGSIPVVLYGILQSFGIEIVRWQSSPAARIWASFGNPNFLAGYLVMIVPLIMGRIAISEGSKKKFMICLLICTFWCICLSLSRAGFLGMIASVYAYLFLTGGLKLKKYMNRILVFLLLIVVIALAVNRYFINTEIESIKPNQGLVSDSITERLNFTDANMKSRMRFMKVGVKMFLEKPVLGFGPDTYSIIWRKYMTKDLAALMGNSLANPGYAHSEIVQVLATNGVVGLLAYLFLLFSIFRYAFRSLNAIPSPLMGEGGDEGERYYYPSPQSSPTGGEEVSARNSLCNKATLNYNKVNKYMFSGAIASIFGILVNNQFSFHSPVTAIIFWFLIAYIAAACGTENHKISISNLPKFAGSILAMSFVIFCAIYTVRVYLAETYFPKGLYFEGKKSYDKAIRNYSTAISLNPYEQTYYQNLGKVLITRSEIENDKETKILFLNDSVKTYTKHLSLIPQDALSWNGLGIAYMNLSDASGKNEYFYQAEKSFNEAISYAPVFLEPHINLGSVCYVTGKTKQALEMYSKALDIDSRNPLIYFNLGNIYAQEGNIKKAISFWQDALDLDPNYIQARINIDRNTKDNFKR